MKPGNVIRPTRPEQGLGEVMRAAAGLASMGHGQCVSAHGAFVPASRNWRVRAEDLVQPGEGSA